jgi:hypothetical protein
MKPQRYKLKEGIREIQSGEFCDLIFCPFVTLNLRDWD